MNEYEEMYHLARLALSGKTRDVFTFVQRLAKRLRPTQADLADRLDALLVGSPLRGTPLRDASATAKPVDADSRLELVRQEEPVEPAPEPIWGENAKRMLEQVLSERVQEQVLLSAGLVPTRTLLFTGPPGVGKTLTARWLASKLNRPLLTLDLSAVMSSYLGKTGVNVRQVLDYGKSTECVLFLDEFDAVAKRRDDRGEIGELKRLVTVLLQEIDNWPASGILVAATNHPDLLDPAAWRRFDMVVEFTMPTEEQTEEAARKFMGPEANAERLAKVLALALHGLSFSDIERCLLRARRESVIRSRPMGELLREIVRDHAGGLSLKNRKRTAAKLVQEIGLSYREAADWVNLDRRTVSRENVGHTEKDTDEH